MKSNTETELAEYIRDHHGTCSLEDCLCIEPKNPWLGRSCPNWNPVKASTWKELAVEVK